MDRDDRNDHNTFERIMLHRTELLLRGEIALYDLIVRNFEGNDDPDVKAAITELRKHKTALLETLGKPVAT